MKVFELRRQRIQSEFNFLSKETFFFFFCTSIDMYDKENIYLTLFKRKRKKMIFIYFYIWLLIQWINDF